MFKSFVALCAILLLGGCSELAESGVTCSILGTRLNCGIELPSTQDPSASKEANDEKPDKPFAEPLQRFEEASP